MTMTRFPSLPEEQWSAAQREVAEEIIAGRRGQLRGPFPALLYSPRLAAQTQKLGEYLRFESCLPNSLIEFGVLITARHWGCANIWHSHRALALKAQLDPRIISSIAGRIRPATMTVEEAAVFDFCIELNRDVDVSDTSFDQVVTLWGRQGAIDLIGVCGYYVFLAMVLNTARFPLPEGATRFEP
jgi:4-carboxymuconolactone decarboxylase